MDPKFFPWLKSLGAAAIGGGANAGSVWLGVAAAQTVGVHVQQPDWKTLAIVFASSAVSSVLTYLKKSPLPGVTEPAQ